MDKREFIRRAIQNGDSMTIEYMKWGGELSTRKISDIHYSEEYGTDYIECFCHKRQERRTFKIDRIQSINGQDFLSSSTSSKGAYSPKTSYTPGGTSTQINRPSPSTPIHGAPSTPTYTPRPTPTPTPGRNEGCYIATMAYGDYDHPQVMKLRRFRDEKLLPNFWGRIFVRFYYWISPKLVRVLKGKKKINQFIREKLDAFILHLEK